MKRRTAFSAVCSALAGLWIALLGFLLMSSAACPDNEVFCFVEDVR